MESDEPITVLLPISGTVAVYFDRDAWAEASDTELYEQAIHAVWDDDNAALLGKTYWDAEGVDVEVIEVDTPPYVHQGGGVWCGPGISKVEVER